MQIEKNGITYQISNNEATIVRVASVKNPKNLMIPHDINGVPVTSVGYKAFHMSNVEHVVLPDTLKTVDELAFYKSPIESVIFTANVAVKKGAFHHCFRLKTVKGKQITLKGENIFSYCKRLTSFDAEIAGLLPAFTFENCKHLESLQFADKAAIQDNKALSKCMSMKSLRFNGECEIHPACMRFIMKRKIFCKENSSLAELAYRGVDISLI